MTVVRHRTCSICEANCGLAFELDGRRVVRTSGDPENLLSRGHICPKGTALADVQDDPDRLRRPMRRTGESWEEIDWDTAFAEIGARIIDCAPAGCLADLDRLRATIAARDGEDDGSILLIGRRQVRSNNSWLHNSNRLAKGKSRCTLMLHPEDAAARGIGDGDLVEVASTAGRVQVPAQLADDLMPGVASLPRGFGHLRSGVRERVARALQPGVSFNDLAPSDAIDVPSGTAAVNGVPVTITLAAA